MEDSKILYQAHPIIIGVKAKEEMLNLIISYHSTFEELEEAFRRKKNKKINDITYQNHYFDKMTTEEVVNSKIVLLFDSWSKVFPEGTLDFDKFFWTCIVLTDLYKPKYSSGKLTYEAINRGKVKEGILQRILDRWIKEGKVKNTLPDDTQNPFLQKQSCLEVETELFLLNNHIPYVKEYSYPDLRGDFLPLRFDFKILDKPIVIECQGPHHYKKSTNYADEKACTRTRRYDLYKREYCERNNITLIEIPYNDFFPRKYLSFLIEENDSNK